MCGGYYDDTDCGDGGLAVYWIVVIVIAVIAKILFWSCVCYRWRRRTTYYSTQSVVVVQPATHTMHHGHQAVPVRGAAPHAYPVNASAPPAYTAGSKAYPQAAAQPSAPAPPSYADTERLLH